MRGTWVRVDRNWMPGRVQNLTLSWRDQPCYDTMRLAQGGLSSDRDHGETEAFILTLIGQVRPDLRGGLLFAMTYDVRNSGIGAGLCHT